MRPSSTPWSGLVVVNEEASRQCFWANHSSTWTEMKSRLGITHDHPFLAAGAILATCRPRVVNTPDVHTIWLVPNISRCETVWSCVLPFLDIRIIFVVCMHSTKMTVLQYMHPVFWSVYFKNGMYLRNKIQCLQKERDSLTIQLLETAVF